MNCFNNNRPKLSSSDRTANIKSKAIFKANVNDYQKRSSTGISGKCNNYNGSVGFYNNGKLRNVQNYETLKNLGRGNALCVDGAYADCVDSEVNADIASGINRCSKVTNIKITNGKDNLFTHFSGFSYNPVIKGAFFSGFPTFFSYDFTETSNNIGKNQLLPSFDIFDKDASNCKTIAIDPCNNLFGTNFCSTNLTNNAQGPNKYLAFSHTNKYVIAQGFLYNKDGSKILCDDENNPDIPNLYDYVVSGLFSVADINNSYPGTTLTPSTLIDVKKTIGYSYFTGIGYIFKKCCGVGPNGEEGWWKIYIKPQVGFFLPNGELPVTLTTSGTNTEESYTYLNNLTSVNSLSGITIKQGGKYETGSIPTAKYRNFREVFNYGGGLAIISPVEMFKIFSEKINIKNMMGWKGEWSNGNNPSGNFEKSPLIIQNGSGDPCHKNLSHGNNTQQNYLIAYDPIKQNIKFNIDPAIYSINQ